MMLATLSEIATSLGLTFLHGEREAFNTLVDHKASDLIVMYHEGYVAGSAKEDPQGAWDTTYNLRIWLLIKGGGVNDKPIERTPRFTALEPLMYRILSKIGKQYVIQGVVNFSEGINQTDKNLDGIRFVASAIPKQTENVYCD